MGHSAPQNQINVQNPQEVAQKYGIPVDGLFKIGSFHSESTTIAHYTYVVYSNLKGQSQGVILCGFNGGAQILMAIVKGRKPTGEPIHWSPSIMENTVLLNHQCVKTSIRKQVIDGVIVDTKGFVGHPKGGDIVIYGIKE